MAAKPRKVTITAQKTRKKALLKPVKKPNKKLVKKVIKKPNKKPNKKLGIRHVMASVGIFVVASFLLSVGVYRAMPSDQISNNVMIADLDMSGMTYEEARERLQRRIGQLETKPLRVNIMDKTYDLSFDELGINYDLDGTIENLRDAQYGENFFHGVSIVLAFEDETKVEPVFEMDKEKFSELIESKVEEIKPSRDAKVIVNDRGGFEVIGHEDGLRTFYPEPYESVQHSLSKLESAEITLEHEVVFARVKTEAAEQALNDGQVLIDTKFVFKHDKGFGEAEYSLKFDASWVEFRQIAGGKLKASIKKDWVSDYLKTDIAPQLNREVTNAILKSMPEEGSNYAIVEGVAKEGRNLKIETSADRIMDALADGLHTAVLDVASEEGRVINETGDNLGELRLLSSGKSNFEGSPYGRDFNIRKGLNEKVNNILVAPGDIYDFNRNLGPVTYSTGWKDAIAIFVGRDFTPVPGGGLCQVSTTAYRAAVNAGLPILEKNNHTFYIKYYEKYGNGLDAAIYPGFQNMTFENNTGNFILVQAYDDGSDAIVNIYGTADGRKVDLRGPIYPNTIPEDLKDRITLRDNQIGWWQSIHDADGKLLSEEAIVGTYRVIPKQYRVKQPS